MLDWRLVGQNSPQIVCGSCLAHNCASLGAFLWSIFQNPPSGCVVQVEILINPQGLLKPSIWGQHLKPTRGDRGSVRSHATFKPEGQRFFVTHQDYGVPFISRVRKAALFTNAVPELGSVCQVASVPAKRPTSFHRTKNDARDLWTGRGRIFALEPNLGPILCIECE